MTGHVPPEGLPWCPKCTSGAVSEGRTGAATPLRDDRGLAVSWVIISGTSLQTNHNLAGKLCDYLIKRSRPRRHVRYLAVELKSRVQHVQGIVDQLQAGADLLGESPPGSLIPVLVHSGRMGTQEYRVLGRLKVMHRGRSLPVVHKRTGADLGAI